MQRFPWHHALERHRMPQEPPFVPGIPRATLAAVLLGLALASKHVAVLFLPFWILLVWGSTAGLVTAAGTRAPGATALERRTRVIATTRLLAPTALTAAAVILPFLLWDPAAFWEDTVRYIAGMTASEYSVAGIWPQRDGARPGVAARRARRGPR